ncbi:MAG: site-specific integrase [Burkholderiaceae bacterium]|nr:site-specific integrase [Burkholderiaceae bacterium]
MTDITMREALATYCSKVSILKKGHAQEKYRIDVLCRSFLADKLVREVTSVDISTYRDQRLADINPRTRKPLSNASVRLELCLLSNFFDICRIELGYCDDNPVARVRKPKPAPGRERRISAREERQILRYCNAHSNRTLYSIFVLALETAMRQGELLSLEWQHVNLRSGIAHLPSTKNGTKRDVPLSQKAREAFLRLDVKTEGRVFGYTSEGFKSTWRLMMQRLNIDNLHFHDTRHEAASRLFELGTLDIMEIAAITGHKSLAMLKRYTHLSASKLVKKLEGNRNKGKLAVMNNLVPYPAVVERVDTGFRIRFLDFTNLVAAAECAESALSLASDLLLRQILTSMRSNVPLPAPDEYLEFVDQAHVIMVDPLPLPA